VNEKKERKEKMWFGPLVRNPKKKRKESCHRMSDELAKEDEKKRDHGRIVTKL